MPWMLMLSQVFLPLALLAWMTFFPAAGLLAWGIQLISITAVLMGIGLVSLWAMPPFWVPYENSGTGTPKRRSRLGQEKLGQAPQKEAPA